MKIKPLSFVIGLLLADAASASDNRIGNAPVINNNVIIINCIAPNSVGTDGSMGTDIVQPPCPPGGGGSPPSGPPAPPSPTPAVISILVPWGSPGDLCNPTDYCSVAYPQPDAHTLMEIQAAVQQWQIDHPSEALGAGSTVTICTPSGCTRYTMSSNGQWGSGVFTPQTPGPPYYPPPPPPAPPPLIPPPPYNPPPSPPDAPPGTVGPIEPTPPPCNPGDGSPCAQPT